MCRVAPALGWSGPRGWKSVSCVGGPRVSVGSYVLALRDKAQALASSCSRSLGKALPTVKQVSCQSQGQGPSCPT